MRHSFVFWKELTKEYVPGKDALVLSNRERKRLDAFLASLKPDVMMVVVSDEPVEGKQHMAYVREHYNVGTIDASRLLVRPEFAALIRKKESEGEFALLCRMYETAGKFAVYERREEEVVTEPNRSRTWKDAGEYPTPIVAGKNIWKRLKKAQGEVLPFFQHLMIQNLYHAGFTEKEGMSEKLKEEFCSILEDIGEDIICRCEQIPNDVKIWLLEAKSRTDILPEFVYRSGRLKYHNLVVTSLKDVPYEVTDIRYEKKKLVVWGEVIHPVDDPEIHYYAMDNRNREISFSMTEKDIYYLGQRRHTRKRFEAGISLTNKPVGLRFMYRYHELYRARVRMTFSRSLRMVPDTKEDYAFLGQYMLRTEKRILFAAPLQKKTRLKQFFTFGRKSIKIETEVQQ